MQRKGAFSGYVVQYFWKMESTGNKIGRENGKALQKKKKKKRNSQEHYVLYK